MIKRFQKIGFIIFLIGLFILPSIFFFGAILLLFSAILSSIYNRKDYFSDNWNKSFFICGLLILLSAISHILNFNIPFDGILDSKLSLVGIFNWIPFFWLFWAFKTYLDSNKKRKSAALMLVAGTFPVLISGFGQYFFNWTGPMELFNGLIIWYQRPLGNHGLTGPFNNQNYAGAWLSLVWPFSIAFILEKTNKIIKKGASIFFFVAIGVSAILTNSRNAWGSILVSLPLVIGIRSLYWLIPIIFISSLIITITASDLLVGSVQEIFRLIIPEKIWMEFIQKVNLTRLEIFTTGLQISLINPFFGLGAGSFPIIYELQNNNWLGHPHNLFLELAISYGYPVAILLIINVSSLIIISATIVFSKKLPKEQSIFDKAWWVSIFVFLISQLVDVQYFDGRISIVFWLLLSGLKAIIEESTLKNKSIN